MERQIKGVQTTVRPSVRQPSSARTDGQTLRSDSGAVGGMNFSGSQFRKCRTVSQSQSVSAASIAADPNKERTLNLRRCYRSCHKRHPYVLSRGRNECTPSTNQRQHIYHDKYILYNNITICFRVCVNGVRNRENRVNLRTLRSGTSDCNTPKGPSAAVKSMEEIVISLLGCNRLMRHCRTGPFVWLEIRPQDQNV